jgi:hypothetical protein
VSPIRRAYTLALAAGLFSALAATAAAEPAAVTPRATIESATVSGDSVRVRLAVVLAPVSSASACTGRVGVTVRLSRTRSVRGSGALAAVPPRTCVARIAITLPRSRDGRIVPFRLTFRGNSAIRRFARTERLRVRSRSTPTLSLDGTWIAAEEGSTDAIFRLSVRDNMITAITQVRSYTITCTRGSIPLDGMSWNVPLAIAFSPGRASKTVAPLVGSVDDVTLTFSLVQFTVRPGEGSAIVGVGSAIGSAKKPGATGCPEPFSLQLLLPAS